MEADFKTLVPSSPMNQLSLLSSFLPFKSLAAASPASPVSAVLRLLRCLLVLSLRLALLLLLSPIFLSSNSGPHDCQQPSPHVGPNVPPSPAERALSHVLSVVSRVPVASRKYELARSLADRLLDDNLRFPAASSLNAAALSSAFRQAIRGLELAVLPPAGTGHVAAAISAVRKWAEIGGGEVATPSGGEEKVRAEKMEAEMIWLAQKMAECGVVEEAVRLWGEAAGLARVALAAEPQIQVAFVRVSGEFYLFIFLI